MKKSVAGFWGLLVVMIVVVIAYRYCRSLQDPIPNTPETQQIQKTIRLSYEIDLESSKTFDDSLYPTVYINDSRGGKFTGTTLDMVRTVRNDKTLTEDSVGYLDYMVAYNQWRKEGAQLYEKVWAKAKSEGRDYLTAEETKSLVDSSGRFVAPPIPESMKLSIDLTFISMKMDGDVAQVVIDDGAQTKEMTLVRKNNQWFIAGVRIISSHP